jgi:NADH-quinone oxidoreductase subunit G
LESELMAKIWVDGAAREVDSSKNLLQTCLELGLDLPYFCWHPALGSVGACRQCAVKQFRDESDTKGRLVMACMTPASEGTRISLDDEEARAFRRSITELLMVNHPHDCPVCDEGGECHLQDMTVMTGHRSRKYRFAKKTYVNQNLGPFVNHEMNRCIQCYRCVHFYRDYAGGRDLQAFAAHDHVYFGRHEDGVLESSFAGNLVEICPTGVFTDKTLKSHYARKWDLETAPSVCVHCSLGCNTIPGERSGTLRRIRTRYHGDVNGYFLCDRGRFGYEFVNHPSRIRRAHCRASRGASWEVVDRDAALLRVAQALASGGTIGIGSPRASMESNLALRELVGRERFFQGVSKTEADLGELVVRILTRGPSRSISLREIEQCDAVLLLGEDVSNTAPLADLAIRQAVKRAPEESARNLNIPLWHADAVRTVVQHRRGPLYVATVASTELDGFATGTFRGAPEEIARLGCAIAHALDPDSPRSPDLALETARFATDIAEALRSAKRPVVVTGTGLASRSVLEAAANVAWAGRRARETGPIELFCVVAECNSLGLSLFGAPSLEAAFRLMEERKTGSVIILENDLFRRAPEGAVEAFLSAAKSVVVLDHVMTPTAERADLLLPAGSFAEADGTFVNNEGRAQRFYQVYFPDTEIQESWRWLRDAIRQNGKGSLGRWENAEDALAATAAALPTCREIARAAPSAGRLPLDGLPKIPRMTHRYSGRTALRTHVSMHEAKPPQDGDSALSFSMEGYEGEVPSALMSNFWAPGWNSTQSLNRFQEEIGGPLRGGDAGVRLLEPAASAKVEFFAPPAAPSRRGEGEWLVVAVHHVFGSEELSALSAGIEGISTTPYAGLAPEDAAELALGPSDEALVTISGRSTKLKVRILLTLPKGLLALPVGVRGIPVVQPGLTARIAKP